MQECRMVILSLFMFLYTLPSTHQASNVSSSQLFTFSQPQAFLRLEPNWPLSNKRKVTFLFKTDHPHGLLMYHGVTPLLEEEFVPYELYITLNHGRLKVIHIFHPEGSEESFYVGKGLNRDKWHNVSLTIIPATGELSVFVNDIGIPVNLPSLQKNGRYNVTYRLPLSFLYFGGIDSNIVLRNQKYTFGQYYGCLGEIYLSHSEDSLGHVSIKNMSHVETGCQDRCTIMNNCLYGSNCINHYTSTSCDCFGTNHEGANCQENTQTTITLRGYSYITYRVYDWADRAHSDLNRISITFKTQLADSVLFYGLGEHPQHNYLAASIIDGAFQFEIDFGDGPLNITFGQNLNDSHWHNFTIIHHGKLIYLYIDSEDIRTLESTGPHHHLHLDPELYIGGAPVNSKGIRTRKKFVGCFKDIYFNYNSILYSMSKDDVEVRYHSLFPPEYECSFVSELPLTFPLAESRVILEQSNKKYLNLTFEIKTKQLTGTVAFGMIKRSKLKAKGYWEVSINKGVPQFTVVSEVTRTLSLKLQEPKFISDDTWHQIKIMLGKGGKAVLIVDTKHTSNANYPGVEFTGQVILGTSSYNMIKGITGCMKNIFLNDVWIDPRSLEGTSNALGKVSMDNCQLVDPCQNPLACEHGGRCRSDHGETKCDCSGTGYTGKTCHFSIYKRTCEELYLVGYRESGVYKIDIDRNGPLPPAHVYCEMGVKNGAITTRVENNMSPEMVVRKPGMDGFYIDITYREFTPVMIQSLIHHSKQCSQHLKYECYIMPVGLRSYTWMQSSADGVYLTSIGSKKSGHCQCGESHSCDNKSLLCNCDSVDARWRVDEGTYTKPSDLGITRIFILQPDISSKDAEARLSLGPVECVETDTQQYVITFRTPYSYLEVPGWRSGDLAFSFRTSNTRAVLIHQAGVHAEHGYFRVLLMSERVLSFEFTVNRKPYIVKVSSRRQLNSGEWQQVWVDYDIHHMRFTVNLDSEIFDLRDDEEVGLFEGPLYVGGVQKYHGDIAKITEGFIGCFRGLVVNGALVNLYQFMNLNYKNNLSTPHVDVGCEPSCSPNPCQNEAVCLEFWGYYKCQCTNPLAHSGNNCEFNINKNAMTFITAGSYYHNSSRGENTNPILQENILLNFRTYSLQALLLYAFDYLNNFVQLHIDKGELVVLTFNYDTVIAQGRLSVPGIARGERVQVHVQRTPSQTVMSVNNRSTIVNKGIKLLTNYSLSPWTEGKELESVKPVRGLYPTVPHSQLFLGSVNKETVSTDLSGFAGCIHGLKIGSELFDLEGAASEETNKHGDLRPGCIMKCDSQPCENGGMCIEHWEKDETSCDCSLTSYTGKTCHQGK